MLSTGIETKFNELHFKPLALLACVLASGWTSKSLTLTRNKCSDSSALTLILTLILTLPSPDSMGYSS